MAFTDAARPATAETVNGPQGNAGQQHSTDALSIEPYRDRNYWQIESERVGTDFPTLIRGLAAAAGVAACDTCGQLPCVNPSFCKLCRAADRAHRPRISRSRQ